MYKTKLKIAIKINKILILQATDILLFRNLEQDLFLLGSSLTQPEILDYHWVTKILQPKSMAETLEGQEIFQQFKLQIV